MITIKTTPPQLFTLFFLLFSYFTKASDISSAILINDIQAMEKILLEDPKALNRESSSADTPIIWAVLNGARASALFLIENNADLQVTDQLEQNVLHYVSGLFADEELALAIIQKEPLLINKQNIVQNTPLHLALLFYKKSIASLLIKNGAKLNIENRDGSTQSALARSDKELSSLLYKQSSKKLFLDPHKKCKATFLKLVK